MRHRGTIIDWKDEQGYGFIAPDNGGADVFVHIKAFSNKQFEPSTGETVTFELHVDLHGRTRAERVRVDGEVLSAPAPRYNGKAAVVYTALILLLIAGTTLTGILPIFIPGIYLGASVLTFVVYAKDKHAARKGAWRTQESALHFLELIGGWPGALAGQRLLRHKSSKRSFLLAFWIMVILNTAVLIGFLTPQGLAFLHSKFIDEMWLW